MEIPKFITFVSIKCLVNDNVVINYNITKLFFIFLNLSTILPFKYSIQKICNGGSMKNVSYVPTSLIISILHIQHHRLNKQ